MHTQIRVMLLEQYKNKVKRSAIRTTITCVSCRGICCSGDTFNYSTLAQHSLTARGLTIKNPIDNLTSGHRHYSSEPWLYVGIHQELKVGFWSLSDVPCQIQTPSVHSHHGWTLSIYLTCLWAFRGWFSSPNAQFKVPSPLYYSPKPHSPKFPSFPKCSKVPPAL